MIDPIHQIGLGILGGLILLSTVLYIMNRVALKKLRKERAIIYKLIENIIK